MVLKFHPRPRLNKAGGGLEMTDIVSYALPFDPISRPLNSLVVEKKIKEIFEFREKKLEGMFQHKFESKDINQKIY